MIDKIYKIIIVVFVISLCGCKRQNPFEEVINYYINTGEQEKIDAVKFLYRDANWHYEYNGDNILLDIDNITADFLIKHVDYTYELWKSSKFCSSLTFDEYCEYLLPYNTICGIGPKVTAEDRSKWLIERGLSIDSLQDWEAIVKAYNYLLYSTRQANPKRRYEQRQGLMDLDGNEFTDCMDKVHHCILNLRALGIPCVMERNFGYRTLKAHHAHCAVYDGSKKCFFRFNAEDTTSTPSSIGWDYIEMQNVYRVTYKSNMFSPIFLKQPNEPIPSTFMSPCLTDVTRGSFTFNFELESPEHSKNIFYLSIFNSRRDGLLPITWGLYDSVRKCIHFKSVLPHTLYFLSVYQDGKLVVIHEPFYITCTNSNTEIVKLSSCVGYNPIAQTDSLKFESVALSRKYPIKAITIQRSKDLIGSVVEASNDSMFDNSVVLWRLRSQLLPSIQTKYINNSSLYKYYRFRSSDSIANISILRWFHNETEYITDSYCKAYDGDMKTAPDKKCVEISFDEPVCINRIKIAPLNADNGIKKNHNYSLRYWDIAFSEWRIIAYAVATEDSLVFRNIPKGTLLWLKDHTEGEEEMPFIFVNNKQIFLHPDIINDWL